MKPRMAETPMKSGKRLCILIGISAMVTTWKDPFIIPPLPLRSPGRMASFDILAEYWALKFALS